MERKIVLILVVIIGVIGSFGPIFSINEPYDAKETYQETEPYQVEVPYQTTEKYETPIKYIVDSATYTDAFQGFNYVTVTSVVIRNIDDAGGTFKVYTTVRTLKRSLGPEEAVAYVAPGQSYNFRSTFDTDMGEDVAMSYTVDAPNKIAERIVTKTRLETRYRTVQKERTVTKYRQKKVSLVEILFG